MPDWANAPEGPQQAVEPDKSVEGSGVSSAGSENFSGVAHGMSADGSESGRGAPQNGAWSVYLIRCADKTLYCGVATDVPRRIAEHNAGPRGAKYTRTRRPVELVCSVGGMDRASACRLEYAVKQRPRVEKEAFLRSYGNHFQAGGDGHASEGCRRGGCGKKEMRLC